MYNDDPFPQAAADLQLILARGKDLQKKTSSSGLVTAKDSKALKEIHEEALETFDILTNALQILNNRGGKINGTIFSANEIILRQNTLRSLENELETFNKFYTPIATREREISSLPPQATSEKDNYIMMQEQAQQEEIVQQEEVMDRLAHGLQELKATGININEELQTQTVILTEVDRNMSTVQSRLRAANDEVDRLLSTLSNKGKICTILGLIGVIIVLYILF